MNLIGDHTDYSGGLVCPMAIDLGTTVHFTPGGDVVELVSDVETEVGLVPLDVGAPRDVTPAWARYIAGVVAALRPSEGGTGRITTTLPVGSGLSSSAALEVATALALGADADDPEALARVCQRAEQLASGVPCGIMDQLVCAAGVAGHAVVIDCSTLHRRPVPLPPAAEVLVVHSGASRALAASAYAIRRGEVEAAASALGAPLRDAEVGDVGEIADPVLRSRARHVISENGRVRAFADALAGGDLAACGRLMVESHTSLRDDFEVSTPALDALVEALCGTTGVFGARLTGAGFGGCVVALGAPGVGFPGGRVVKAAGGATVRRM